MSEIALRLRRPIMAISENCDLLQIIVIPCYSVIENGILVNYAQYSNLAMEVNILST